MEHLLFSIGPIRYFSSSPNTSLPLHLDPASFPAHLYVQSGTLQIRSGSYSIPANAGTVFFLPEQESVQLKMIRNKAWRGVLLPFQGVLCKEYTRYLQAGQRPAIPITSQGAMNRIIRRITSAADDEERSLAIFDWFLTIHSSKEKSRHALQSLLNGTFERILEICGPRTFSIKELASALGCSSVFLSYRFKRSWGMPAGQLLKKLRYLHAVRLLETTHLPLEAIAFQCGFSKYTSLSNAILRISGKTPKIIRIQKKRLHEKISQELNTRKPIPHAPETCVPPASTTQPHQDEVPVVVREGPFFLLDGGLANFAYETPYELSISAITTKITCVYTLSGEAIFEVGDFRLRVSPGMAVFFPTPLNGRWLTPHGNWKRIWIMARGQWTINAFQDCIKMHGWCVRASATSEPVKLARRWVKHWNAHRNHPSLQESRMAYLWLLSWRKLWNKGGIEPVDNPDLERALSRPFFRRIKTIKQFAQNLGYSRSYLSTKLKKQWTGGTPAQIIRRQRLAQAALELRETTLPIHEIARRASYAHTSTFIASFSKEFHVSPLCYRLSAAS